VPFTQFSSDIGNGALPNFSFVIPDLLDDAHSCPDGPLSCSDSQLLSRADQWLNTNISPLLSSSQFQNNGVLLVLFDEANDSDIQHGGGHVALVAVGPKVKAGFQSMVLYQHENTLSTICQALAVKTCPGDGATASSEGDMFQP
jgi:phosphatidylinositol-3-phosphatase